MVPGPGPAGGVPEPGPVGVSNGGYPMGYPTSGTPCQTWTGRYLTGEYPTFGTPLWDLDGGGGTQWGTPPQVPPFRPGQEYLTGVPHLRYRPMGPGRGVPDRGYPTLGTPMGPGWGVPDRGLPHLGYPPGTWTGGPHLRYPPPIRPGWGGGGYLTGGYPTSVNRWST